MDLSKLLSLYNQISKWIPNEVMMLSFAKWYGIYDDKLNCQRVLIAIP